MGREVGYTTILKLLQNMTAKRLVRRDESSRSHVYAAARPEQDTQRTLVADFVELVFNGSTSKLIIEALAAARPSPEVTEIRKLLACKWEIGR